MHILNSACGNDVWTFRCIAVQIFNDGNLRLIVERITHSLVVMDDSVLSVVTVKFFSFELVALFAKYLLLRVIVVATAVIAHRPAINGIHNTTVPVSTPLFLGLFGFLSIS